MTEKPEEPSEGKKQLNRSYRQARKEMWLMIATWVVFALWTWCYNAWHAIDGRTPARDPVLGMPQWITFGIAIPWFVALTMTVWFALCYMKDAPLQEEPEGGGPDGESGGGAQAGAPAASGGEPPRG